jgi:DNA-binding SARP family transcriptional activator/pimeloyl-ACP methyl ester carboxylesterase
MSVRFRVLGPVAAMAADGRSLPLAGERQRLLLVALLAQAGAVVSAERLADLLWGDHQPDNPAAALHSQVARLRRTLRAEADGRELVVTRAPGYLLAVAPAEVDAGRFDQLTAAARDAPPAEAARLLDQALALWRGPAYAGFSDREVALVEAIRLEEARLAAVEGRAAALLAAGRAADAVPAMEAFVAEHPLREQARATLMRGLYALGRQADALRAYQEYRSRLAEELGIEPAPALRQLEAQILRHQLPEAGPDRPVAASGLATLRVRYLPVAGGRAIAWATAGSGPRLFVLPGWVSSLDVLASGRDPRSSLLDRLSERHTVVLFDRRGTGLTGGPVADFGLAAKVEELVTVVEHVGGPVDLLAMSEAGPVALALAAERPELVRRLVLFGTYAAGPAVFTDQELRRILVELVRAHWGLGSRTIADLYRPGASEQGADHLAKVLRDSADREVAAGYLEVLYGTDVTALLPDVRAPVLVLHYRGDRLIPFRGGQLMAAGLPDATFLPLDGAWHLPDVADLDRVAGAIAEFLDPPG